jgi:hypothetical protein
MRTCYILPQGKVPRLKDTLFVRVTEENLDDVYDQYVGFRSSLCVLLAPKIPTSSLLKFVESVEGDLHVVVNHTPDLVFLSRFSSVTVGIRPTISPFPGKSVAQVLLEECKRGLQ